MNAIIHDRYDDSYLRKILRETKSIAMVGLSANWNRPSFFAAKYLLDRGYKVAISDVWNWSADELAGQLGALSAANRAAAIHKMLHDNYEAQPAFRDPAAGPYYELRRR